MYSDFENIEGEFGKYALSEQEKELMERFREGHVDAFEKIYNRYSENLYKYGQALTNDLQILEDTLQDLFITIWNKRDQIDIHYSILFYLIKSYRRLLLSRLKEKRGRQIRLTDYVNSIESIEEPESSHSEYPDSLHQAIKSLPTQQYEVVMLKYIYGHTTEMITEVMGITIESSNNLASRALTSLRKYFSEKPLYD